MEAIEFAVKFDDGLGEHALRKADIVLVGVSRTSKTPLSIYLGYLGHKTANVPVVKGIEPPSELFEIDRSKIVGLTIEATRLAEIRRVRVRAMRSPDRQYADRRDLRGARGGGEGPAPPRPDPRRVRALDRGDQRAGSSCSSSSAAPSPSSWRRRRREHRRGS